MGLREVKELTQGHTASGWQRQDLTSKSLAPGYDLLRMFCAPLCSKAVVARGYGEIVLSQER